MSPAFMLVDAGFNVFMGNNRGNALSREHTNPYIENKFYWDFSFWEMGKYDAPAQIDKIYEITGKDVSKGDKIGYIGHS